MKIYTITILLISNLLFAQTENKLPFKEGEWLKFELHYGILTAGYSTLEIKNTKNKNQFLVEGNGYTTGMFKWFFKVKDNYKTYINKETLLPDLFKRKVYEGGYTIDRKIKFNRIKNRSKVFNLENKTDTIIDITPTSGDMISSFYYARRYSADKLDIGSVLYFDVFMDYSIFKFSLKFLGRETINTKFGKIKCLKFAPGVQGGRVFKDDESVIMWITDDENKIPIRIKSSLRVGAIKIDLYDFKGLKYPLEIDSK